MVISRHFFFSSLEVVRLFILLFGFFVLVVYPAQAEKNVPDYTVFSIEELLEMDITSVSRKTESLREAAAAIYVVTSEDIRRSGATTVPEILRMVPGIQVARIDSSTWAVSSRGFNRHFSNKLLVLIDGRSVYTTSFSGVYWSMQEMLLEDVDRIEVIRGPGATLWGANAVHGVINIITKSSSETQGGLLAGAIGDLEKQSWSLRYGGSFPEGFSYRLYAKHVDRGELVDTQGHDSSDEWDVNLAGFRTDWQISDQNNLTLQGDILDSKADHNIYIPSLNDPPQYYRIEENENDMNGGNVLFRWENAMSSNSDLILQAYYDHKDYQLETYGEKRDTFDVEFKHRFSLGNQNEIVWGGGWRYESDEMKNTPYLNFAPAEDNKDLYSLFIEDEYEVVPDRLSLSLGSKFEHNDITGFEIQPNIRSTWTPGGGSVFWASVSRSVRTPSRVEYSGNLQSYVEPPFPPYTNLPTLVSVTGSQDFVSEELIAYELGYRDKLSSTLSTDLSLFYNDYDELRTGEPLPPQLAIDSGSPYIYSPYILDNKMEGRSIGLELVVNWFPVTWWELEFAYSYLDIDLQLKDGSADPISLEAEELSPEHQVSLRSLINLPYDLELDLWLRMVDELPSDAIDSYAELDLRIGWQPRPDLRFSLVGQNLLNDSHQEYESELFIYPREENVRNFYAKVTWQF